ncbi:MAG: hypothetical protein HY816_22415 [Candidatus Wallbacteria bacterium]|nr:hypothetical protein [Candidatus Wallbacteria bacterium]
MAGWVGLTVAAAIVFARVAGFFHDDAFVMLRYARNLLAGYGPVWNPGERVEGYTSFLHLGLSALAGTWMELPSAARLVNLAAFGALLAVLGPGSGRALGLTPLAWTIASLVAAASGPLAAWTMGGLEAPLMALVVTVQAIAAVGAVERAHEPRWVASAGLAAGLACWTRPEGAGLAGSCAVLLACLGDADRRARFRALATFALVAGAFWASHLAWRRSYYGEWLPNTYYAKVWGLESELLPRGLGYVWSWVSAPPWLAVAGVLAAGLLLGRGRAARALIPALLGLAVAAMAAAAGGDHMPAHRLLVPVVGLIALLAGLAAHELRAHVRPSVRLMAALSLAALQVHSTPALYRDPAAHVGELVGRYIDARWPAGSLVALNTAGSTPYFAPRLAFLDMLGLTDRVIARRRPPATELPWQRVPGHSKGDGAYVLARRPDFIILGYAEGDPAGRPRFLGDLELARLSAFQERYSMERVTIPLAPSPDHARYAATRTGTLTLTYYGRRKR